MSDRSHKQLGLEGTAMSRTDPRYVDLPHLRCFFTIPSLRATRSANRSLAPLCLLAPSETAPIVAVAAPAPALVPTMPAPRVPLLRPVLSYPSMRIRPSGHTRVDHSTIAKISSSLTLPILQ